MAQAQQGNKVQMHYTGKLKDGTVFDSSYKRDPIEFKLGEGKIIPGLEQAVEGMQPGEKKTVEVGPEKAFGKHRSELLQTVDRSQFPDNIEPEVGQQLQIRQQGDQPIQVTVTEVNPSGVTLDANHPLAGRDLIFDIEVVDVSEDSL